MLEKQLLEKTEEEIARNQAFDPEQGTRSFWAWLRRDQEKDLDKIFGHHDIVYFLGGGSFQPPLAFQG